MREKTRDSLASMTPRDRMLLLRTGVFLLIVVMTASIFFVNKALKDLKSVKIADRHTAANKKKEIGDIATSVVEYQEKISQHSNTDLSAFLSKSSQSGI